MSLSVYAIILNLVIYIIALRGLSRELIGPKFATGFVITIATAFNALNSFMYLGDFNSIISPAGIITLLVQIALIYFVFRKFYSADSEYTEIIVWTAGVWISAFVVVPFIAQRIFG